jgi:maltose phosphorylase
MEKVADNMYFPVSKDLGIYLQQDGFFRQRFSSVKDMDATQTN